MSVNNIGKASIEYDISNVSESGVNIGIGKEDLSRNQITVQVACENLDSDIEIILTQTNTDRRYRSTPIEDRENKAPISLTLGDGNFTIIADTFYCENAFVALNKGLATTGRVTISVIL